MSLIEKFVKSPVSVSVGVLLVALFGYVSLTRMPLQLTPEVQTPTISVETRWPGASPQEVEREIVLEQEEYLKSVEGVTKLSSESGDSEGEITMEFVIGTDMDEALLRVNSQLQQVPEYPEDADRPVISTSSINDRPIARFMLGPRSPEPAAFEAFRKKHPELAGEATKAERSRNSGLRMLRLRTYAKEHPEFKELLPPDSFDVLTFRRFTEDEIEAVFERVPGVSQAEVNGGYIDELQIVVDPERLAARGLTVIDVRNALRGQNQDTSAGDFWEGKRRWVVRTLGQFRSVEQVENQLLTVLNGAPVYVKDVAEVRLGYKKPDGLARRFGAASIGVNVMRETGSNVLDVMEGIKATAARLNGGILKQKDLELVLTYDETEYIHSAIGLVNDNIFVGGALTMAVLMFFLYPGVRTFLFTPPILLTAVLASFGSPWWFVLTLALIVGAGFWFARGSLVVGLAIPVSIIGTFLVLDALGRTLNVISLAGLAFAVGQLVDSAVVVLDNIYRRYDELGESPLVATCRGTAEVWGAVVVTTMTTVAVFLPVVFIQEEAGQLFRDIALAITAAVLLSAVVAVTVVPAAAARLLTGARSDVPAGEHKPPEGVVPPFPRRTRPGLAGAFGRAGRVFTWGLEAVGAVFISSIVAVNAWIQKGVVRQLVAIVGMIGVACGTTWYFWPKVEYLPTGNRNLIFATLNTPPGYNIDQLTSIGVLVEEKLQPYWDVDPGSPEAAKLDYPLIDDFFFYVRGRQVMVGIRTYDPQRVRDIVPLIREIGATLPGTFTTARQSSLFERGGAGGRTIEAEIAGPELPVMIDIGRKFLSLLSDPQSGVIPGAQAQPKPSLDLSSPEVHVEPKLVQAAQMGVTTSDLGYEVNALVDGAYAGDYFLGGDKIDLTIIGEKKYAERTQDIAAVPIATPIGQLVPLSALADVRLASGPEQIIHRETQRAITIEVTPPETVALQDAMDDIQNRIVDPMVASGELPEGYQVTLAGAANKLRQTWQALVFNVGLAVVITYLLMAALFESWLYPLVIILSVPFGAIGGVLGLDLLNVYLAWIGEKSPQQLDVLTMLGFVILIGTVVNNPTLIVHQALNHIRHDGYGVRQAVLESTRTRIRPIFITTTMNVLGLLPLVLFPGAGSELYRGLGAVVLGGMAVSTVVTLVLVPSLFTLTLQTKQAFLGGVRRLAGAVTRTRDDRTKPPAGPARPVREPSEPVVTG